jgi:hypothetical protein
VLHPNLLAHILFRFKTVLNLVFKRGMEIEVHDVGYLYVEASQLKKMLNSYRHGK